MSSSESALREAERLLAERRPAPFRPVGIERLPYPLRNVLRRWRGALGMMLGVGIALGIGMALLGSSNAALDIYTADFRQSGANLYVVTEGGNLIPILPGDTPGTIEHARHQLAQIRGRPEVRAAVGVMTWPMAYEPEEVRRRDEPTELISVLGVDGDPSAIPGALELRAGRWLQRADELVVGERLARTRGWTLGSTPRLNERTFQVVGIGQLRGFGFNLDSAVAMDYWAFRPRADLGDVISIIAIDSAAPAVTRASLGDLDSVTAYSPDDLVRQAEAALKSDQVMHWIFIGLVLAIAGLFVSNMLSGSVAERRLDFATLRAIGLPRQTILLAIAGEAVVISLVAGLVGIALSSALGALMNAVLAPLYGLKRLYAPDLALLALVFGLALGLGLLAGLLPARRATSVDPVEVLREA
jgi:putative ABC transport system permease protein